MTLAPHAGAERLDSVQLLRAIAATAVVFFHLPLFRNGAWGVDIFFVISGFIMALVTANSSKHFFSKRVIRVVPLYWLGTFGVFGVALLLPNLLGNTTADLVGLVKSLLFIPYLKGEYVQPILYLGWTLNFEMFFYALFALSMAISHRHRLLICSAALLGLVLMGKLFTFESLLPRFYTDDIILEFALGMGCYALYSRTQAWRMAGPSLTARITLVAIGVAVLAYMPFNEALKPMLGHTVALAFPATVIFLALVHGLSGLRLPWILVLIGDASYSLYLFHPYVLKVINKVFHVFDAPGVLAYVMAPVTIGLCYLVAIGIYRLVELPLTNTLRRQFLEPRRQAKQPTSLPAASSEARGD
ncbi:Acyltransferase family protein [compost metagenome]